MVSIKDQIRTIITANNLSDRQFALKIGVNPSVVGSMFIKSTEPSSKVIQAILLNFPEISPDWLLLGNGEMLRPTPAPQTPPAPSPSTEDLINIINQKDAIIKELKDIITTLHTAQSR